MQVYFGLNNPDSWVPPDSKTQALEGSDHSFSMAERTQWLWGGGTVMQVLPAESRGKRGREMEVEREMRSCTFTASGLSLELGGRTCGNRELSRPPPQKQVCSPPPHRSSKPPPSEAPWAAWCTAVAALAPHRPQIRSCVQSPQRAGGPAEAWTGASGPQGDNEPRDNKGLPSQTAAEPGRGAAHHTSGPPLHGTQNGLEIQGSPQRSV